MKCSVSWGRPAFLRREGSPGSCTTKVRSSCTLNCTILFNSWWILVGLNRNLL